MGRAPTRGLGRRPPWCSMNCPVCHDALSAQTHDDVPVGVCARDGVWLDKGELLLITEHERFKPHGFFEDLFRRAIVPPRRDRQLACPVCGGTMETDDYHDVQIDRCRAHGVWLDAGEMEAILNNLRLDPAYVRGIAVRFGDAGF